jgi:hypothetical protein
MNKSNILQVIGGLAAITAVVVSAYISLPTKGDFASAMEYTKKVELRLSQKINNDAIRDLNLEMWDLLKKHKAEGKPDKWEDEEDQKQYRNMELELNRLIEERQILKQQIIGE